jgi:hypothetical protein
LQNLYLFQKLQSKRNSSNFQPKAVQSACTLARCRRCAGAPLGVPRAAALPGASAAARLLADCCGSVARLPRPAEALTRLAAWHLRSAGRRPSDRRAPSAGACHAARVGRAWRRARAESGSGLAAWAVLASKVKGPGGLGREKRFLGQQLARAWEAEWE